MKDCYAVIKHLLITEKGTSLGAQNKYLFSVDRKANKVDIKRAVQEIYKVKVKSVNTMHVSGKKKRVRFKEGKTASWKKAIVTLAPGQSIEIA